MALSDYEKQVLEEMEQEFRRDEPRLARQMEQEEEAPALRLSIRRIALGIFVFIAGLSILVGAVSLGYSGISIVMGVIGFAIMVGGVWYAISSPEKKAAPLTPEEQRRNLGSWSRFIDDQEQRWEERKRRRDL